jgi:hypothetical protein
LNRAGVDTTSLAKVTAAIQNVTAIAKGVPGLSPIRSGRVQMRKALGTFNIHSKVIRVWDRLQIGVSAHEVGHALADVIFHSSDLKGVKLDPAVARELHGLGKALYGNQRPNGGYIAEGWAEFVSKDIIGNDMAKLAPATAKWVRSLMDGYTKSASPHLRALPKAYDAARTEANIWRLQGSDARAEAQQVPHDGWWKRFAKDLAENFSYRGGLEEFAALEDAVTAAEKQLKRKLRPTENPATIAHVRRGSAGAVLEYFVNKGVTDIHGTAIVHKPLAEVLAPVFHGLAPADLLGRARRMSTFWRWMWARRSIERWTQNKNPGMSVDDAAHIYRTYDSQHFQTAAKGHDGWWNSLLDYYAASSPAAAQKVAIIRGGSEFYIPLARALDEQAVTKAAANQGHTGTWGKRMTGSDLAVRSIDAQTFITAESLISSAHREQLLESIFQLSRHPGLGHLVEELAPDQVQAQVSVGKIREQLEAKGIEIPATVSDADLLVFYEPSADPKGAAPIIPRRVPMARRDPATGKIVRGWAIRYFQVDPAIYQTLEGLPPVRMKFLADVFLGTPKRLVTLGYTGIRPSFQLFTNLVRDPQSFVFHTRGSSNPAKIFGNLIAGYGDLIAGTVAGKSPALDMVERLGVSGSTLLGSDVSHARRAAAGLYLPKPIRLLSRPFDTARDILSATEKAPRLAEIRQQLPDIGWTPGQPITPDAALRVALAYAQATVDFRAKGAGEYTRFLREAVPFFGAALQSSRTRVRAMRARPLHVLAYGGAFVGLALALWWQNKDKDWYRALPWRERFAYLNIEDEENINRIPLDMEGSALAAVIVGAADSAYTQDPRTFKEGFNYLFQTLTPPMKPVIGGAVMDQLANAQGPDRSPIVPGAEARDLPGAQAGSRTSATARLLGETFPEDISPRRVDALLRSLTGGIGPDALAAVEKMAGASTHEAPDRFWWQRPGGKFSRSTHVADFYDLAQSWSSWKSSRDVFSMSEQDRAFALKMERYREQMSDAGKAAEALPDAAARTRLYRLMDAAAKVILDDAKKRGKLTTNPVKAPTP